MMGRIKIEEFKMPILGDWLEANDLFLIVKEITPAKWSARFEGLDGSLVTIRRDHMAVSANGQGETVNEAVENYLDLVRGQNVITHDWSNDELREIAVPDYIKDMRLS